MLCAMLPVLLLGAVSYLLVVREYRNNSWQRLGQTSASVYHSVLERLQLIEAEVGAAAVALRAAGTPAPAAPGSRFTALSVWSDGRARALYGDELPAPNLDGSQESHLQTGGAVIITISGRPCRR